MRVIYIDGSPLCRLGMKTLLGGGVITLSSPNMNIIKNISPAPDLIIMEFPQEIYRFEAYLEFIKYSRGEYKGVRLLFFIDKTSPLIRRLSLRRSRMRFCTNGKRCRWCERPAQRWPARDERTTRGEPAAGGGNHAGEAAVLCETARTEDIRLTARRLNLHPKTVYSHLNNAGKSSASAIGSNC